MSREKALGSHKAPTKNDLHTYSVCAEGYKLSSHTIGE